jgi:ribonuclease T1
MPRSVAIGALLLAIAALVGCAAITEPRPSASGRSVPDPSRPLGPAGTLHAVATRPPIDDQSGLPVVSLDELPPEATATIDLIDAGGPFPNTQDGAVFENREGLLPTRERGYYHEYTVATPGSADRGARRIVGGADGEMYWSADHYDSFAWIDR